MTMSSKKLVCPRFSEGAKILLLWIAKIKADEYTYDYFCGMRYVMRVGILGNIVGKIAQQYLFLSYSTVRKRFLNH